MSEERGFTHVVTALRPNRTGIQMGFLSEWGAKLCMQRLIEKGYYETVYIVGAAS